MLLLLLLPTVSKETTKVDDFGDESVKHALDRPITSVTEVSEFCMDTTLADGLHSVLILISRCYYIVI